MHNSVRQHASVVPYFHIKHVELFLGMILLERLHRVLLASPLSNGNGLV